MIPAVLASPLTTLAVVVTQAQPPAPGSDRGEEFGESSPIALVVILLLAVATALLIRSMSKRLRNIPESFDPPEDDAPAADAPEEPTTPGPGGPAGGEAGAARERSSPDG